MTILLIYPIGAGGEFIGCTVNPVPSQWYGNEHVSSINRYYYKGNELFSDESASVLYQQSLSFEPPYDTINGAANLKKRYRDFINIESHHFSQETWTTRTCPGCGKEIEEIAPPFLRYQYDNELDIKQEIQEPLEVNTPILCLHNHFNIHKFFKGITKSYCLISNSYALRLVWSLCCIFKLDSLDRDGDVTWFNEASLIDDAQYLQLERRDKPLYEKYKTTIEDDIEFITPAELDLIQDGLATKYKKYTEINIEMIKKLPLKENLMADYTGRFSWLEKVEYI